MLWAAIAVSRWMLLFVQSVIDEIWISEEQSSGVDEKEKPIPIDDDGDVDSGRGSSAGLTLQLSMMKSG